MMGWQTFAMTAILVTGMSGAGKSTTLAELARRGFETVDTDDGDWIELVDGERLWVEPRIAALLAAQRDGPLFVQGTVANQGRFSGRFDAIVLLSAPADVLFDRLRERTTNDFGESPAERAKIGRDIEKIEPLLRASATHEVKTTRPLGDVVDRLIEIARAG
jgi:dephospho-CoA kinase